jgi:hypothetical protein
MRSKRGSVLPILLSLVVACGGESGPMGPGDSVPQVAGRYEGVTNTVANSCTGDVGIDDSGVLVITQSGRSVTVLLAGGTVSGDIQSSGNWRGTGRFTVSEQGITITLDIEMEGAFSGGRFTSSQTAIAMALGDSCTIIQTFDMVRTG